jgi:hypothetical protein
MYIVNGKKRDDHSLIERLRDVLSIDEGGVKDVQGSIDAFIWLGLLENGMYIYLDVYECFLLDTHIMYMYMYT